METRVYSGQGRQGSLMASELCGRVGWLSATRDAPEIQGRGGP